jgi:hypothetical protein
MKDDRRRPDADKHRLMDMERIELEKAEGPVQRSLRHRYGVIGWRRRIVVGLTRVASLGLLTAQETGIIAVFTKTPLI